MARASTKPKQVEQFVAALKANAKEAWGEDDIVAQKIAYASLSEDGKRWIVADNFERFFSTIYTYHVDEDRWSTRTMYAGDEEKAVSFEALMGDASIMFTG